MLCSPVCVGPGGNPKDRFSHDTAHIFSRRQEERMKIIDNDRRRQQEMMMRMGMGRDGPMGRDGQMGGQMGMRDGAGPGGQGMQGPNREEMMLRGQVRGYYLRNQEYSH